MTVAGRKNTVCQGLALVLLALIVHSGALLSDFMIAKFPEQGQHLNNRLEYYKYQ
jgi:hypothetical protein